MRRMEIIIIVGFLALAAWIMICSVVVLDYIEDKYKNLNFSIQLIENSTHNPEMSIHDRLDAIYHNIAPALGVLPPPECPEKVPECDMPLLDRWVKDGYYYYKQSDGRVMVRMDGPDSPANPLYPKAGDLVHCHPEGLRNCPQPSECIGGDALTMNVKCYQARMLEDAAFPTVPQG